MCRAGILLYIVSVGVHSVIGPDPLPKLEYSCANTGEITITNADVYTSIYVLHGEPATTGSDANKNCSNHYIRDEHQPAHTHAISGCKKNSMVTVVVTNLANNGKPNFIIGGNNFAIYDLECITDVAIATPAPFTIIRSVAPFGMTPVTPTQSPIIPYDLVTMEITPKATIKIGDELNLTIKGTGVMAIIATNCTAYNPENEKEQVHLITDGSADTSHANTLIDDFVPEASGKVEMVSKIHAFHFKSGNQVTFICTIAVCRDKLVPPCNNPKAAGKPRSKRNADAINFKRLESTIVVRDRIVDSNSVLKSISFALGASHWLTILLAWVGCIFYH